MLLSEATAKEGPLHPDLTRYPCKPAPIRWQTLIAQDW
jgi:hypothetical protein